MRPEIEIHSWTVHRERDFAVHSPNWDVFIKSLASRFKNLCAKEERLLDDFKKAVSYRPTWIGIHTNSQWLRKCTKVLHRFKPGITVLTERHEHSFLIWSKSCLLLIPSCKRKKCSPMDSHWVYYTYFRAVPMAGNNLPRLNEFSEVFVDIFVSSCFI